MMTEELMVKIGKRINASRMSRVALAQSVERLSGKSSQMSQIAHSLQIALHQLKVSEEQDIEILEALLEATGLSENFTVEDLVSGSEILEQFMGE